MQKIGANRMCKDKAANGSVLQINCSGPARKLKIDKLSGAK